MLSDHRSNIIGQEVSDAVQNKNPAEMAICINDLSKSYHVYKAPIDRLKQFVLPRLQRWFMRNPKTYYSEFKALDRVSFEVKKGDIVGVIGRNGSGKSTLLQLICGTLHPSNGFIEISGRVAALLELGSGFNPEFTGRENIFMYASVLGLTQVQIEERFSDIVTFADIGDFIEQPIKTYSSGMTMRLAFAVIAHVDADILVIDEALAVGDAYFTQKCMRFLRSFMENGTILFVSHETGAVKSLCNRAIWLDKGVVQQIGTPKEVCESYLKATLEKSQGVSQTAKIKNFKLDQKIVPLKDQRLKYLNLSNLRNDLRIFEFDSEASSFGKGGAQIVSVSLLNEDRDPLAWAIGGEVVTLVVCAIINESMDSPIIGFSVKDRLGQELFGDNTFLTYIDSPLECDSGEEIQAEFTFAMPILPRGDYSINVAIANGTQDSHVQHHWIHDAVFFKSESTSVATGLVGIPMLNIIMK